MGKNFKCGSIESVFYLSCVPEFERYVGGGEVDCCAAATAAAIRRPCDCLSRSKRSSLKVCKIDEFFVFFDALNFFTSVDTPACWLDKKAGVVYVGTRGTTVRETCCCFSGIVVGRNGQIRGLQCPNSVNYQLWLLSTLHRLWSREPSQCLT